MQRIPPSLQMMEALTRDLQAGFAGHPLRQFVRRAAQILLQVGLEEQVEAFAVIGTPIIPPCRKLIFPPLRLNRQGGEHGTAREIA